MDGGDGGQWNTGGAISVKDKSPSVVSDGEQQKETKAQSWSGGESDTNGGNDDDKAKDENSGNLSFISENRMDTSEESHDDINPTSTLVAPEGIESHPSTISAVNDYDHNEQGYPPHDNNKDGIVSTEKERAEKESELVSKSQDQQQRQQKQQLPPPVTRTETNHQTTISPTPSQITQHPKQDLPIETTNILGEEADAPAAAGFGSNSAATITTPHDPSAVSPMPTNNVQRMSMAEGFDAVTVVDIAKGVQLDTAGHKVEEGVAQVPTEGQTHGATNYDTLSHVHQSDSKAGAETVGVRTQGGDVRENVAAAAVDIPPDDGTAIATNIDGDDDGESTAAPADATMIDASKTGDIDKDDGIRVLSGVQTTSTVTVAEAAAVDAAEADELASSQDKAISHGTDSPSREPAAHAGDIPTTRTIPSSTTDTKDVLGTSETDVSDKVTASACKDADCSDTSQGDRQKTILPESSDSAVSSSDDIIDRDAKNYNLDISQQSDRGSTESDSGNDTNIPPSLESEPGGVKFGSNSLHARSNVDSETVSHNEGTNQNSGLPSSSWQPGSKREESNVDSLDSKGMIGMKSGVMEGSRGHNGDYTLLKDSSTLRSRSGGTAGEGGSGEIGDSRHQDTQRNGMNGMPGMSDKSDPQDHTPPPPPSHSGSSESPDILNSDDVTLDSGRGTGSSRHPTTSPVTDDLPKITDGDSLDVSEVNHDNNRSGSAPVSGQANPRNASLTENSVNGSLSTQPSLTDTQPQANGSLTNQNARLGAGAEEMPVGGQPPLTKHRDDVLEANNESSTLSSIQSRNNGSNGGTHHGDAGGTPPAQNSPQGPGSGQQGGTVNQTQNSTSIPPLSATVNGGGGGNGNGVGGHSSGGVGVGGSSAAGGQMSSTGGRDREKSVFLRLSNQIQELEANMSLLSSYLEQISTRLVNI